MVVNTGVQNYRNSVSNNRYVDMVGVSGFEELMDLVIVLLKGHVTEPFGQK